MGDVCPQLQFSLNINLREGPKTRFMLVTGWKLSVSWLENLTLRV
jgi:hypothetical protein